MLIADRKKTGMELATIGLESLGGARFRVGAEGYRTHSVTDRKTQGFADDPERHQVYQGPTGPTGPEEFQRFQGQTAIIAAVDRADRQVPSMSEKIKAFVGVQGLKQYARM